MKRKFLIWLVLIIVSLNFFLAKTSLAAPIVNETQEGLQDQTDTFADVGGFGNDSLVSIVAVIIKAFLSVLGILFLIYIILAGFNLMTAGGDADKVTKAKDTIFRSIIGLIIIVAAYAITYFVFSNLGG